MLSARRRRAIEEVNVAPGGEQESANPEMPRFSGASTVCACVRVSVCSCFQFQGPPMDVVNYMHIVGKTV